MENKEQLTPEEMIDHRSQVYQFVDGLPENPIRNKKYVIEYTNLIDTSYHTAWDDGTGWFTSAGMINIEDLRRIRHLSRVATQSTAPLQARVQELEADNDFVKKRHDLLLDMTKAMRDGNNIYKSKIEELERENATLKDRVCSYEEYMSADSVKISNLRQDKLKLMALLKEEYRVSRIYHHKQLGKKSSEVYKLVELDWLNYSKKHNLK